MRCSVVNSDGVEPFKLIIECETFSELRALFAIGMTNDSVPMSVARVYSWVPRESVKHICNALEATLRPFVTDKWGDGK